MAELGKYKYDKKHPVGEGYWSNVYKAYDKVEKKDIALKIIKKELHISFDHLKKEVDKMMDLQSDFVVKYKDCNKIDGKYYIVTPWADGGDLKSKIKKEGKLSPSRSIRYGIQILKGLQALHDKQIVHLDIKPDNIFIEKGVPKIGDLGLAKRLRSSGQTAGDKNGGETEYLPPEYLQHRIAEKSVDIWGIAIIIYEMLYGQVPYNGKDFSKPPQFNQIKEYPEFPTILKKALNPDQYLRFQSAEKFYQALQNIKQKECRIMKKIEQGTVSLAEYHGKGRSEASVTIKFKTDFTEKPIIQCSVKKLDMYSKDNVLRYEITKPVITPQECIIKINTWEPEFNKLFQCDIEWLAIGE